jgi:hypothetical protein
MDIFEKQETIEAIRVAIKARWIYASIIFAQGIVIKYGFPEIPLAGTSTLSFILASAFFFNFGYWLYIRRKPEKMSNWGLQLIKALQVIMDSIWISAILFFSGTVGKMVIVAYFIAIMNGASLYKRKGMIFSTLFLQFLFTILAILQYAGIMKTSVPIKEIFSYPFVREDKRSLFFLLISFYSYSSGGAVFGSYLAGLFRRREVRLKNQKNELEQKAGILTVQTRELTEMEKAKADLEEVNSELKTKIRELEKYGEVTTGRELKMIELKNEIKNLKETVENLKSQLISNK